MRRFAGALLAATIASAVVFAGGVSTLPNRPGSLKFAVIGDNGTGDDAQYDVGAQMARAREIFAFDLVLMMGDNFYGRQRPADLQKKFDRPYKPLLDAGVVFQAAIGNHDEPHTISYPPLNMEGRRYYSYVRDRVRFVVLDTNALDDRQISWFETTMAAAAEPWKICYFHHPLYSNAGRHGASVDIRVLLEPILVKYGASVVFSGHDHLYERLLPQKGIYYFVVGSGGKLRKGDLERSPSTAAAFDQSQSFLLVEIAGDEMHFEAIARDGRTVDSGMYRRPVRSGT